MSPAGLRSLSPTDPVSGSRDSVYGTQEDYWRGKVHEMYLSTLIHLFHFLLHFLLNERLRPETLNPKTQTLNLVDAVSC
jgi:hypothetical protein